MNMSSNNPQTQVSKPSTPLGEKLKWAIVGGATVLGISTGLSNVGKYTPDAQPEPVRADATSQGAESVPAEVPAVVSTQTVFTIFAGGLKEFRPEHPDLGFIGEPIIEQRAGKFSPSEAFVYRYIFWGGEDRNAAWANHIVEFKASTKIFDYHKHGREYPSFELPQDARVRTLDQLTDGEREEFLAEYLKIKPKSNFGPSIPVGLKKLSDLPAAAGYDAYHFWVIDDGRNYQGHPYYTDITALYNKRGDISGKKELKEIVNVGEAKFCTVKSVSGEDRDKEKILCKQFKKMTAEELQAIVKKAADVGIELVETEIFDAIVNKDGKVLAEARTVTLSSRDSMDVHKHDIIANIHLLSRNGAKVERMCKVNSKDRIAKGVTPELLKAFSETEREYSGSMIFRGNGVSCDNDPLGYQIGYSARRLRDSGNKSNLPTNQRNMWGF